MRVFRDLELVEQLGSGMTRILRTNDTSIFNFMEHFMQVTFYFSKGFEEKQAIKTSDKKQAIKTSDKSQTKTKLNKEKIIELFKENKELKTSQIAEILNLSLPRTRAILNEMLIEKILISKGNNKNKTYLLNK